MLNRIVQRLLMFALLGVMELALALAMSTVSVSPASAQFFLFGNRFPFFGDRFRRPFQEAPRAPAADYSRAPPPHKPDTPPLTSVVVMGDSMADWLAYGLELAYDDDPEMGVVRKHFTWSGLVRNDHKSDHPDWPQTAREILTGESADYVVMMIGLRDRQSIRDLPQPGAAQKKPPAKKTDKNGKEDQAATAKEEASESQPAKTGGIYPFRSDKWIEFYVKRIDQTIAALKSKGVPVFWVGLPPIRGTKSMSDISFLNDLYRSRAEKAGIVYVDVWDGFVDENGRFAVQGPDFEGQIRRLRTPDGVYFTKAGARKLAHFVEREIQRAMNNRATPVALPLTDESVPQAPTAKPGTPTPRPLAGPVVPLVANIATSGDSLLGGENAHQSVSDPTAKRVLVEGETVAAPAGRADDFVWPRRDVAPVGR